MTAPLRVTCPTGDVQPVPTGLSALGPGLATSPSTPDLPQGSTVTARPSQAAVRSGVPRAGRSSHRHHGALHFTVHGVMHRRALPTTTLGWQQLADLCICGATT